MNLNSQFLYDPPQPDNPSGAYRYELMKYALAQKGWPEDSNLIYKLMSPPEPITSVARPGACKGKKVGIIGGGLAGLAAAYELRKLGFDITVFDALEDRVGGRVYTYYFNKQKNLYHELGAMRIPVSHETVWHYLKLFHLPTKPFIQYNPNTYVYLRGTRVRNDREGDNVRRTIYPKYRLQDWEKSLSWQELFSIGLEDHLLSATTEERAEIIQVKPNYSQKALIWGGHSSLDMMQAAGLGQDAISLAANFSPLVYGNLYHSYIDYVQEHYPADTTFLYEIPGGMVRLPMAFYDSFKKANPYPDMAADCVGSVRYRGGYWVDGIYLNGDEQRVSLAYRQQGRRQGVKEVFDYIVCAIPFSTLRTMEIYPLFSSMKMRAIREVYYTPAQKFLLLCRERFWEKDGIVGGGSFTDLPIASLWYPSDHSVYLNNMNASRGLPWNEPGVLIGSYNFGLDTTRLTNQPEDRALAELKREVGEVHGLQPGYLDRIVDGCKIYNWDKQPSIRGALAFFSTEQKRLFSYDMVLPEYGGRVFFAGEHISAVHRWMQGALQSGMQAANDLAAACMQ